MTRYPDTHTNHPTRLLIIVALSGGGPCPPVGRHRYFHKLYALDTVLDGLGHPTKAQLEAVMKGHVLAHAELIGTDEKHGR